MSSLQITVIV